jgi:serpin B
MNNFQLQIFQEINKINTGKNIMVSPFSIYHIVSLTTNGAANKTLSEMLKALCHKDKNEMNKDNKLVSSAIIKFKSAEIANAVFTKFKPVETFMEMVKEYRAKVDILKDADQVNSWCSEATHKKIPKIIDSLSQNDVMVLINAIYFKGVWQKSFDVNKTFDDDFMNFNKEPKKARFMNITDNFDYFDSEELQAISLNYTEDNMKAFIILPKTETDINIFIQKLTLDKYYEIVKKLENKKVNLMLPKFEINFGEELKPCFMSLGMVEAFTDGADFSAMKKENNIKIGRIIHKTFINVDEKGTEAAAATAVVMRKKCIIRNEIMNVNHPFLFIIRSDDLPSGHDILFVSKIESL